MKLALTLSGEALTCALGDGTLTHRTAVRHVPELVHARARDVVGTLERATHARCLSDANLADLRHAGEELFRALLAPEVREALGRHQGPLHLDLDERLVAIPWELLHDGEQFLGRRYDVGRTVATAAPPRAAAARSVGTPMRVLILASDPAGDLPAAVAEAETLVAELDRQPAIKAHLVVGADRATVRRLLKDFDAVHYAGHADPDGPGGEEGGWRLADGRLTPAAVVELAGGLPLPLLVVAHACRSGATAAWDGDPRRLYGLCHAFLVAGARYYLGTQWDVLDRGGDAFALAFWAEVASGASLGTAVRRARERVVATRGERDLGWAPYVLYGDPAFAPLGHHAEAADVRELIPTPRVLSGRRSMPFKRPLVGAGGRPISPGAAPPRRRGLRTALVVGGALALLGGAAVGGWRALPPRPAPAPSPGTVALLGIRPGPSIEPGASADAAALESCLLVGLARRGTMRLVDRAHVRAFLAGGRGDGLAIASDDRQATEAGRALRADYVIYGEATVVAQRPFFSLFCADAATQQVLFADRLDGLDAAGCDALAARLVVRLEAARRERR